jgi:hypothetical protein
MKIVAYICFVVCVAFAMHLPEDVLAGITITPELFASECAAVLCIGIAGIIAAVLSLGEKKP